jgi:hypothetical protein
VLSSGDLVGTLVGAFANVLVEDFRVLPVEVLVVLVGVGAGVYTDVLVVLAGAGAGAGTTLALDGV